MARFSFDFSNFAKPIGILLDISGWAFVFSFFIFWFFYTEAMAVLQPWCKDANGLITWVECEIPLLGGLITLSSKHQVWFILLTLYSIGESLIEINPTEFFYMALIFIWSILPFILAIRVLLKTIKKGASALGIKFPNLMQP